ncbi:hypothetical protein FRB94_003849 [Tulasnella sp. JGI-2019a]|nr:hypothetical protein FRB94_003849 [Tulasnella sp. JGI-2019a]KAG9003698.1 hypothetical protein FRB93_010919 [Tulasnella sp. JGI-2019a]
MSSILQTSFTTVTVTATGTWTSDTSLPTVSQTCRRLGSMMLCEVISTSQATSSASGSSHHDASGTTIVCAITGSVFLLVLLLCLCRRMPHYKTEVAAQASVKDHQGSWGYDLENGDNDSRDDVTLADPAETDDSRRLEHLNPSETTSQTLRAKDGHIIPEKSYAMEPPQRCSTSTLPAYSVAAPSDISASQIPALPTLAHLK